MGVVASIYRAIVVDIFGIGSLRDLVLLPVRFVVASALTLWAVVGFLPRFLVIALAGAVAFAPISLALGLILLPFALFGLFAPEWLRVPAVGLVVLGLLALRR